VKHEVDGRCGHVPIQVGIVALHYSPADIQHYVRHVDVMITGSGTSKSSGSILNAADWLVFDDVCLLDAGLCRLHRKNVQFRFSAFAQ